MKIIFATGNEAKVKEIREIMCDAEVITMKAAGIDVDPEENGESFEANALIKARAVADYVKVNNMTDYADAVVMADDSGLEVDAMDKGPGVHSARWMGHETGYDVKNQAILDILGDRPVEERSARYVCAIAAVLPDGQEKVLRRTMEGYIGYEPEGTNGFGFDPIFYLQEYGCSAAVITPEQKNAISHRGKALRAMAEVLG